MISTRFLTGSLATLAVASAFTLATPAAQAADAAIPCGTPAVEAVYMTIVHEPVFRTVAAVTHTEWLWERDVATYEQEYSRVLSEARTEVDWRREVPGATEYLFTRTVIDQAAVPAVPAIPEVGHFETVTLVEAVTATEYEYEHRITHDLKWKDADWGNKPWIKTGNTRVQVITPAVTEQKWVVDHPAVPGTPAVPEISHVESIWAVEAPAGYDSKPGEVRTGDTLIEDRTTDGGMPAGDGWTKLEQRDIPAVRDVVWAVEEPAGFLPTGASRIAGKVREATTQTSAAAPEGEGWSQIPGSERLVVDSPELEELVEAGWLENVLVSPGVPAGEPCDGPVEEPVDGPAEEPVDGPIEEPVDGPIEEPVDGPAEEPVDGPAEEPVDGPIEEPVDSPIEEPVDGPIEEPVDGPIEAVASPGTTAEVLPAVVTPAAALPETGNDVPTWVAPAGLGALLAGLAMIRFGRRTEER